MKTVIFFFLTITLILSNSTYAQSSRNDEKKEMNDTASKNRIIYTYVEQMPEYPGGEAAKLEYLKKHLEYPPTALKKLIEGRVIVRFLINENGDLSDASILKGIGYGCDEEALRVVNNWKGWKPGKQNGKTVKVWFAMPIYFKNGLVFEKKH